MKSSEPILYLSTYTVAEAAQVLGVSTRTIRRAISKGTINANQYNGKEYHILGEELLKFAGQPEPDRSKEREKLIDQLNTAMEELSPVLAAQRGGSMGVFLHQSINCYVCNDDIRKIIADIDFFSRKLTQPISKGRPQSILGTPTHYAYGIPIEGVVEK